MKKLSTTLLLGTFLFASACQKNSIQHPSPNDHLKQTAVTPPPTETTYYFLEYWRTFHETLPPDFISRVSAMTEDNVMTEEELDEYVAMLGYASVNEFVTDINAVYSSSVDFMNDFNVDITEPGGQSYMVSTFSDYFRGYHPDGVLLSCSTDYYGCKANAAAVAFAGHAACWSSTLMPLVLGLCHASIATIHYLAERDCTNTYEDCIKKK